MDINIKEQRHVGSCSFCRSFFKPKNIDHVYVISGQYITVKLCESCIETLAKDIQKLHQIITNTKNKKGQDENGKKKSIFKRV